MANESIQGFKKSEFQNATPDRVFGEDSGVQIENLPDGIRLYLKEKAIDLGTKILLVNVYRLEEDGGLKQKKVWVGKINNHKPEPDEIAELFGGGEFIWIAKWESTSGQERGIISDVIRIDETLGRAAQAARTRKLNQPGTDSIPVAASVPIPSQPQNSGMNDPLAIIRIMDAAEEKALTRFERMAAIFAGGKTETPTAVLEQAYKGATNIMQQAVEANLAMSKSVNKKNIESLNPPEDDDKDDGEADAAKDGPALPPWLAAFMPQIESGLGRLLNGGPVASAVKTLVLSSDEWREIFNDKDKWGQAVAAMEAQFGSERTTKALDVLLNRRKVAEKAKGKGK